MHVRFEERAIARFGPFWAPRVGTPLRQKPGNVCYETGIADYWRLHTITMYTEDGVSRVLAAIVGFSDVSDLCPCRRSDGGLEHEHARSRVMMSV
jgi:hypothetical protein